MFDDWMIEIVGTGEGNGVGLGVLEFIEGLGTRYLLVIMATKNTKATS